MSKKIFFILLILFFSINKTFAQKDIFILATINDDIITNFDIKKESDYLKILNPDLEKLNEEKILKISKDSLIKEIIKQNEIKKFFDFNEENILVKEYLKNLYTRLNFNNENDFKDYLKNSSNYSIDEVKQKLKIELMWNELIYSRYFNQVKIDKDKMMKKINSLANQEINEYLLSEIVFQKDKDQILENKINLIISSINNVGFENTANIYSLSESSKLGGKIGWVNESNLSRKVLEKLNNLTEGEISEVIQSGNNYLILKVEKIRKKKISINKNDELNKMIQFETNKQLNQFSKIYFDKSIINYSINEK
tara:strand:- start:2410 stop:3339 length:930 start_codon:yes stop_codon:yes gene_type:complete